MEYQIDQSGKIEQTNINTVIALTNGQKFVILLKKQDKRILQDLFKKTGKKKPFVYLIFAALLALIIKAVTVKEKIIVDREYAGHENLIRQKCLDYLKFLGVCREIIIEFGHVGKSSNAHDLAAKVGTGKAKVNKIINRNEVIDLVLEIEKDRESKVGPRTT